MVFSLKVCLFIAYGQPNQTPEIAGSKLGLDLKLILSLGWHSDSVSKNRASCTDSSLRAFRLPFEGVLEFGVQFAGQDMIFPNPVDLQVGSRFSLDLEAKAFQ